jgi:hypothetical protein
MAFERHGCAAAAAAISAFCLLPMHNPIRIDPTGRRNCDR